jgi:hypothetical protein
MEVAMPVTRNIQSSILFASPFIGYQPANISNGEPAINAANLIKQTMLGAPFTWPWNRVAFEISIPTIDPYADVSQAQDYAINTVRFAFLEKAWLTDPVTGEVKPLTIVSSLAAESAVMRPQSIAVQAQDDDSVTLRINSLPDRNYFLNGFYQQTPLPVTSTASSWAPIPDHLSYIYDWGFLGMLSMITKDVRQALFQQKFVSHLLGAQDGITATQRNIFIGEWLALMSETGRNQLTTQQGVQARSAT